MQLKDSGERRSFSTGAVRDVNEDKGRFDLICPFAVTALAKLLQKGCKKYGERNWEKGIDMSSYVDSAIRHLLKWVMGLDDEDHLVAAFYNIHCLVSQRERIKLGLLPESLDNLPHPMKDFSPEAIEAYLNDCLFSSAPSYPDKLNAEQARAVCKKVLYSSLSGGMALNNGQCIMFGVKDDSLSGSCGVRCATRLLDFVKEEGVDIADCL